MSSDEYLQHAKQNRRELEEKGKAFVAEMVEAYDNKPAPKPYPVWPQSKLSEVTTTQQQNKEGDDEEAREAAGTLVDV